MNPNPYCVYNKTPHSFRRFYPLMHKSKHQVKFLVFIIYRIKGLKIALNWKKCVHTKRQNKQKKLVILSLVCTSRVNVSDFYRDLRTADLNETLCHVQNCYSVVTLNLMIINFKSKEVQPRDKTIDLNKPTDLHM